jgi:threonine dehydratase
MAAWEIDETHLSAARALVRRHLLLTPLVPAPSLGRRVFLKLETAQHTGSFKVRGALACIASREGDRAQPVYAASAGNHGLGVAWAARLLGRNATVFVPKHAPMVKRNGIAGLGARVVVTEHTGYDATERVAREAAEADGAWFLSPWDDPWVAAGNGGTVGLETLEALPDIATIVAPVGGGGLVAGLDAARRELGRHVSFAAVQSEACPSMHRSFAEGRAIETFEGAPTLADGLEGGVSTASFAHVRRAVSAIDLVSEAAIASAMRFARRTLGIVVEGSAATVIAWARDRAEMLDRDGAPVVLVVTGKNVDAETLDRVLREPESPAARPE